ncbi:MAG: PH domain-containing protein [Cellulomonadaceae bacterium]|nr:PH domain-containing protein [Cellulomonadaceae bacterium]
MVYRPGFGRVLTIAIGVLGAALILLSLVHNPRATVPYIAPVAFVVLWVWAAYWRPAVIVSPASVEIRNVLRTIELPWPTIQRVETRYALTLYTAVGDFSAWAAPAPGRNTVTKASKAETTGLPSSTYQSGTIRPGDLASSASGQAALMVRTRWEELRDAGLLDNPQVEFAAPRVQWHTVTLIALAVLAAASVATIVLL